MTTALPSFRPVMNRIAGLITQLYWVQACGGVTLSSFLLTCAGVGVPLVQACTALPRGTWRDPARHRGTPRDTEGERPQSGSSEAGQDLRTKPALCSLAE